MIAFGPDTTADRVVGISSALSSAGFTDVSVTEQKKRGGHTQTKIDAWYPPKTPPQPHVVSVTPISEQVAIDDGHPISAVFRENLYPESWDSNEAYRQFFHACLDFLQEITARFHPEHVALFDISDWQAVHPETTPLADNIAVPPEIGVYSPSLLSDLGGLNAMYDDLHRYAETDSGHVLAVSRSGPWSELVPGAGGMAPAGGHPDLDLSDPFTAFEPGEYGTDAVITKDDIEPEFTNEALTLERVYRDESDNLRRIEDDSFVRRLIDDGDVLGELPDGVDADDERLSALIEGSIPPAFVRLDGPKDESVVSKTLALDIKASKFELLVSLAGTARSADVSDDVMTTIEGILDELGDMDDQDGIDQYIQAKLL